MKGDVDLFRYVFQDRGAAKTLCLLHGTGGDEYDLLPLAEQLTDRYNFLSLRGNVITQGMNRFFGLLAPGVFDRESMQVEVKKLIRFLRAWYMTYEVSAQEMVFLGYSNGATMILATCFSEPQLFSRVVLLHGMLPYTPSLLELDHVQALVTLGEHDQMIAAAESRQVEATLEKMGAVVTVVAHAGGHEIREVELRRVKQFLEE